MSNIMQMSSTPNVLCLCRLCGTETISQRHKIINIFDNNGVALNIKSKISNCLGFDVSEHDFLPKILCEECAYNLEKFNEFKIKSNKTALYLIDLFTKQMSVGNNETIIKTEVNEETNFNSNIFEPEIQIKIENNVNQLTNVQNLPLNLQKISFQCNICGCLFPTHAQAIHHVNSVHKSHSNKINVKKSRKTRPKNVEIRTEYKCAHCPKVKDTRAKMAKHIRQHLETLINYKCTLCGMKLKTKYTLTIHMKIHNKEYNHVCNYCGKCFITKSHFDLHVRTKHTKDYPFQCTKCDKKFPNKYYLKSHDQRAHNNEYNYTCDICNRSFKIENDLKIHKINHNPIETRRKYKCQLCDSSYVKSADLKHHMLGHTGELNFECTHCDKKYKNKRGLDMHLLIHTGEKNHVCDFCGKAFALNTSLADHRRIHTGERPFKCDACQKSFNQRSALSRHKKSCTKIKE